MLLIDRDATLRLTLNQKETTPLHEDEGYVFVSSEKQSESSSYPLLCLSSASSFDEDCCSLASSIVSSASSTSSTSEDEPRRVTFADTLVTEINTRPYTPKEDIPTLFYSCEETARFRQEYRLERKLLAELDIDSSVHREELSGLFADSACDPCRHRISHVVVLHNDKIETFGQDQDVNNFFDNDSFWSGSITWY